MPRPTTKSLPEGVSYLQLWENQYKPEILKYHEVPLLVVATALGTSTTRIQEQLRSGLYPYGIARPCKGGHFSYEVYPLRLISFVEGSMGNLQKLNEVG